MIINSVRSYSFFKQVFFVSKVLVVATCFTFSTHAFAMDRPQENRVDSVRQEVNSLRTLEEALALKEKSEDELSFYRSSLRQLHKDSYLDPKLVAANETDLELHIRDLQKKLALLKEKILELEELE